jgi:hypothetical protein
VDNDSDNDGIPAAWEAANGLNDADPDDAANDNDSDGATNLEEYLAGTNPNSSASRFDISSVQSGPGGIQITVPVVANHYYRLMASTNLQAPWTEVGRALPAADGTVTWTIPSPVPVPRRYYFQAEAMPCE